MIGGGQKLAVAVAIALLAFSTAGPIATSATSTYLTNGIILSGMKQSSIGGYEGVIANYSNHFSSQMNTVVYLDLINSAGQTVYWNRSTCYFGANQEAQCYVLISSAVPKGVYAAYMFITTPSNVPISVTKGIQVII